MVLLVRGGAAIPHIALAQSTDHLDWSEIELRVFGAGSSAEVLFRLPESGELRSLRLEREGEDFALREDPLRGRVDWRVHAVP